MGGANRARPIRISLRCIRATTLMMVARPGPPPAAPMWSSWWTDAQAAARRTAFSLSVSVRNTMTSAHVIHAAKAKVRIIGGLLVPAEEIWEGRKHGACLFLPSFWLVEPISARH